MINRIKSFIADAWDKLSPAAQEKILSAWHTFAAAFITVIAGTLAEGHIEWTKAFVASLIAAAIRAGWKAMWTQFTPPSLGGIRGK